MRTNDLRKLIQTQLKTVCSDVFYQTANPDALYPHVVFSFDRIDLTDLSRQDYRLLIDVWDNNWRNTTRIDSLCDTIEHLFHTENMPQDYVLPTFYLEDRKTVLDEDKSIQHRIICYIVQNYER